jgi:predicted AAA+ superfamily ATPase
MRPLSLTERDLVAPSTSLAELLTGTRPAVRGSSPITLPHYTDEILRSGFPAMRTLGGRALRAQLDGYLARIVERDFPEQGQVVRRPQVLRAWLAAYAAASSTTTSYDTIRDAASAGTSARPAKTTTMTYRDVLSQLWLLEPVPGWIPSRNHLSRLGQAPKHQLADPALAARLLGVSAATLLDGESGGPDIPRDGSLLGALLESLVTQSIRVYAQANEATVHHLRTHSGDHEVDLIVERDDGRILAIEVKLNPVPDATAVKHLTWLEAELGDQLLDKVVITAGTDAYRRPDGVAVVPAALLGP